MKQFIVLSFIFALSVAAVAQTYKVGSRVPDFSFTNEQGSQTKLSEFLKDKQGVILVFTCNTCPYAQAYEQRIMDLHRRYDAKGFPVLAINPNLIKGDAKEDIAQRIQEKSIPYTYVLDDEKKPLYKAFGATRTPEIFILKKKADAYTLEYSGAIDDNYEAPEKVTKKYVEQAMADVLLSKRVAMNKTVAIGCTIKR